MYIDYLEIAKELKYDLSVHNVLFPKNLKEAHDNAVKNRRIKAEKDLDYPKRYKELIKMYEYEKDGVERKYPYCDYELIPKSDWNYGFADTALKAESKTSGDISFSQSNPPITITAKMQKP